MTAGEKNTAVLADSAELYLDLLQKSLTNTIFFREPNHEEECQERFVHEFIEHYIRGSAITMLPMKRMANLKSCIVNTLKAGVPGDLIETGVWRGGATIFMRGILKAYAVTDRIVWVADSFQGLPQPDATAYPIEAQVHSGPVMKNAYKHFAVSIEEVQANFRAYGLLDEQVRFLQGWFKDTLREAPIERLALLRLDGDYYESTHDALDSLYDRLSIGGYVIIDDYGEERWTYCKKAVDEFRAERGIGDTLIKVDSKCYYWQRSE